MTPISTSGKMPIKTIQTPQFSGVFSKQSRSEKKEQRDALQGLLADTQDVFLKEIELKLLQEQADNLLEELTTLDEAYRKAPEGLPKDAARGDLAKKQIKLDALSEEITTLQEGIKGIVPELSAEEQDLLANIDEKKLKKHLKKLIKGQNSRRNFMIGANLGMSSTTLAGGIIGFLLGGPVGMLLCSMIGFEVGALPSVITMNIKRDDIRAQNQQRALKVRFMQELVQEGVIDMTTVQKLQKK